MKFRKSRSEIQALVSALKRKGWVESKSSNEDLDFQVTLSKGLEKVQITHTSNGWCQIKISIRSNQ